MIPNEASCPVFSFTSRRKSVVELRMSGRKEKRKKKNNRARAYLFLFRPSFSLHFVSFVRRSFCRVFRFCAAMPIIIFDQFDVLQYADACDFAEEKKKRRVRIGPIRACSRPTERERVALFILFPKVAKKRMCVIFVRVTRCGENGKKMERKDAKR